jgi:hypothetical protein
VIELHPRLQDPAVIHQLSETWARTRSLRLTPLMTEASAKLVLDALLESPFSLLAPEPGQFRYQFWGLSFTPEDDVNPVLAAFGEWLLSDVVRLCTTITSQALTPTSDRKLLSTLYCRGCYLDAHNDADGQRRVAYVVGLTEARWPAEEGGHLEFLDVQRGGVVVTERRPPGWNSLDLFDVFERHPLHRVQPLLNDHPRRVFSGWFYGEDHG